MNVLIDISVPRISNIFKLTSILYIHVDDIHLNYMTDPYTSI